MRRLIMLFPLAALFAFLAAAPPADAQFVPVPYPAARPAMFPAPPLPDGSTPDAQVAMAPAPAPNKGQPPYGVPNPPSKQQPPYGTPNPPSKVPPVAFPPAYGTPQTPNYGTPQTYATPQTYGTPQVTYGGPPCQTYGTPQQPPCNPNYGDVVAPQSPPVQRTGLFPNWAARRKIKIKKTTNVPPANMDARKIKVKNSSFAS